MYVVIKRMALSSAVSMGLSLLSCVRVCVRVCVCVCVCVYVEREVSRVLHTPNPPHPHTPTHTHPHPYFTPWKQRTRVYSISRSPLPKIAISPPNTFP